jgi:hypothetical protein
MWTHSVGSTAGRRITAVVGAFRPSAGVFRERILQTVCKRALAVNRAETQRSLILLITNFGQSAGI